ncbi:MAG: DUF2167 domain-containing protein [Verrucomicrobia bacterium]|nr:MAG: DUF2167 domain-containing protein [Verrucomicrobiota bacterium]
MTGLRFFVLAGCGLALAIAPARAQKSDAGSKLNVLKGPAKARLESVAQIDVPAGYIFIDGKGTRALLKSKGEPTSGQEVGLMVATNENWSVFFEFSNIGYVKDDEKDKLDADKLLESIKRGTAEANKERQRAGNPPLEIVGWEVPPKYDDTTHNLEWAVRATSEGRPLLNYNTRLLGRKGVMEVVLVVDPEKVPETLPVFRKLLTGYAFTTGQTYAEYRPGDKVAKVGLAALVLGGAAVGAAKLGLFAPLVLFLKKAWKLVVVAIAAVAASLKKLLGRLFSRKGESGMGH